MARNPSESEAEFGDARPDELREASTVRLPIGDTLDLHTFRPSEVPELVDCWLAECSRLGFRTLRIIHGKGTGALRRTVQAILARHPAVASFETADEGAGGWGATRVTLR